jgi:hypothetical protein
LAKELNLSNEQVDNMPLRYFYNYVAGLEQMIDDQKKQIA